MHPTTTRFARQCVVAGGLMLLAVAGAPAAAADTTVTEGSMTLTVSQSENLPLEGAVLTVSGSGFDESKGVYVAVCVDNGPGEMPTPCIGGVNIDGEGGGSGWISSNPPEYAQGLPTPWGPGGTFELEMVVDAVDPVTGTDCTQVTCVVSTRADHTRLQDRSLDVKIPLTFSPDGELTATAPTATASTTAEPSGAATAPADPSAGAAESTAGSTTDASVTESTTETSVTTTSSTTSSASVVTSTDDADTTDGAGSAEESDDGSSAVWWVIGGVMVVVIVAVALMVARRRGGDEAGGAR